MNGFLRFMMVTNFQFAGPLLVSLVRFSGAGAALPRNFKMASKCIWLVELELSGIALLGE